MSGCTAAARCCVLRPGLDVSSASNPLTLASWRAFTSLFITSAFCGHCYHRQAAMVQPAQALPEHHNMTAIASRRTQTSSHIGTFLSKDQQSATEIAKIYPVRIMSN